MNDGIQTGLPRDAAPNGTGKGQMILIAEDDSFLRKFYARILGQLGFTIRCVEDGLAAWETILRGDQHYDLLITDNEMPRLNGLDLAHRLKASCIALPVIMISGSIGQGGDYYEHGVHASLLKPCSLEDLKQAILRALPPVLKPG